MDDTLFIIIFVIMFIPLIIFIVFFVLNKKAMFAAKQRLRKRDPLIHFIHPSSNRLKQMLGKFNPQNEKEIIIMEKKGQVGYPEEIKLEITSKPVFDENNTPTYWAIWGDNKTLEVDLEKGVIKTTDIEENRMDFLRIFELVYAWLSLGKKPTDYLTKVLMILVVITIGVLAINAFFTWELLQAVTVAG